MTNTTLLPHTLSSFTAPRTSPSTAPAVAVVAGTPRVLLRLEGAALLVAALVAYAHLGGGWGLFASLFLAPDLAFLGYLAGPRVGAIAYNTTHSTLGWALLGLVSLAVAPVLLPYAVIGLGHVGFDRMLGYGLKYGSAFGHTHLGVVGRADVTPGSASRG